MHALELVQIYSICSSVYNYCYLITSFPPLKDIPCESLCINGDCVDNNCVCLNGYSGLYCNESKKAKSFVEK